MSRLLASAALAILTLAPLAIAQDPEEGAWQEGEEAQALRDEGSAPRATALEAMGCAPGRQAEGPLVQTHAADS